MFVPINSLSLALSLLRGSPDSVVQCSSRVQCNKFRFDFYSQFLCFSNKRSIQHL